MAVSWPIKLDGSETADTPAAWDVTSRSGKGSKINATEHDNTVIALREAVNELHDDKADKVSGASNNDLSGFDAGGNLKSLETSLSTTPVANKVPKADAGGTLELWLKDPLRQRVEAATGGQCTVLYDDADLPSYMRIIPAMNATDLGLTLASYTGRHPAFLVNTVAIPEIFVGMFQASMIGTKAYSLPGMAPKTSIDFDAARAACVSKGSGWHLMTNWEWAAVTFWCMANGVQPRGNTDHARAHDKVSETGRPITAANAPGVSNDSNYTLTGTGPYSWRHDGTPAGIADLVGNVWEWVDGMRLNVGDVEMLEDNNIALCTEVADEGSWASQSWSMTNADPWSSHTSASDNDLLRLALLSPGGAVHPQGRLYVTATDIRMPSRGGTRGLGAIAGLAALHLNNLRSSSHPNIGFRPAFIPPEYL